MRRFAVLLPLLACCAPTHAQLNVWDNAGAGGVWNDTAKWDLGHAPLAGEQARIYDGSTVDLNGQVTPQIDAVYLGLSVGSYGGITASTGQLNTTTLMVGNMGDGLVKLNGTAEINMSNMYLAANGSASTGSLLMNGGTISGESLVLSNAGASSAELNDGLIDLSSTLSLSGTLTLAAQFQQNGGTVQSPFLQVGSSGLATYNLSGGLIDVGNLYVGNNSSATGTLYIEGGNLSVGTLFSGTNGTGTTLQQGGTVSASLIYIGLGPPPANGAYKLEGGTLKVQKINRGNNGGTSVWSMIGGILEWTEFGGWSAPFSLIVDGGLLRPYGTLPGSAYVRGKFYLGPNAEIEYQLQADKIVIHTGGSVELHGGIIPILTYVPPPGYTRTLIDNDDADPVIGNFAGLPEGATVVTTYGGDTYNWQISYVGGDGNDVTLTHLHCPPDLNNDGFLDNGDLGLFVTLFLAGDLAADFNNDGFLDNGDIISFITAFLAGC